MKGTEFSISGFHILISVQLIIELGYFFISNYTSDVNVLLIIYKPPS